MSAMDLFDNYYQELIHSLPMNDETFLTDLREHCLLSDDINTQMESMTVSERASYFLDSVIKPTLHNNNVLNFHTLLNVMRESKLGNVKELSIKIKNHWLKITPSATWSDILQALRSSALGLTAIAEEIEMKIKDLDLTRIYEDNADIVQPALVSDDVILNKSVIDYFKSAYKKVQYATDDDWAPYESKIFIELAFVVHKNPKVKNMTEIKSTAKHQGGGLGNIEKHNDMRSTVSLQHENTEIYFSEVTTQRELDMVFGTSSSDSSSILPKTTLIEGAPGIGKTVVAREIAKRWAQNEMLPDIKLLLLIYLNKTDMNKITNFEELMQDCYEDKDAASGCANYFVNSQGKNLMIIFDGYDEMATGDQKEVDTFLIKLLKRVSLPDCHLVVTSRPYITAHLHRYCDCRVEIMGFTENDRLSYFKENLSEEKFQKVTTFLQKYPIIDSFCYIPLHLINFLYLVKYDIPLPKTQTELTGNTVRLAIARNKRKYTNKLEKLSVSVLQDSKIENIIASVAGFAYKMLEKKQFVFSEEEVKTAGTNIEDNNDNYGLLKAVQLNDVENEQQKKVYSFVHFSVQEYLAAYHLSKMYSISQLYVLNHKFWDGKYFGVWRMYAGLTKGNNIPFKAFLSKSYVITGLHHLFGYKFAGIADEFKKNKVIYLQLYQIFLEAPDSEIKESLSTVIKNDTINLSEETLSITDTNMLSHFIAKSSMTKEWQTINLSKCGIDDDKLQSLYQGLCIEDGRKKPIINNLNISNNHIKEMNTIIDLIAKFEIVHLKAFSNILTYKRTMNVGYVNKTLKTLDLSINQFESEDVCNLCNALVKWKNLEELYLNYNKIDASAESCLVATIVQWDNLREFKCNYNYFSNPTSTRLFEFTVTHLKYINNNKETKALDFHEKEDIANFLCVLSYTKHLSGKNSKYISRISQLCRLSLQCAESHIFLTVDAMIFFQEHFKLLEELNLSGLTISEESAHNLAAALSTKLQYLKMNDCKLTSKVAKFLPCKIKITKNIKELQLSNNCIDDEATKDLLLAFLHCNSFEVFKFEGNKFEDKSKSLFKFLLSHLKFSGLSLNLSGSLDGVTSFITLLEYMKEVPTVKSVYVENVSKVHHLNLNCLDHQSTNMQLKLTIPSSQGFEIFNQLESLNLSGISISESTANHLIRAFGDNLQLEQLFMNNCQITSPTINIFCQQLKFNSLKVFELSGNFIDDEATEELAIAILHWNLLEYVKLGENQFSTQGMLLLEMLTRDLESEVTINFMNNHYVVKSFIKVLDYASNNSGKGVKQFLSNLKKVTEVSLQVEKHLEMTFNASTTLQNLRNISSLNISGIIITDQVAKNLCVLFNNNQKSLTQLIMNTCKLNSMKILSFVHKLRYTDEITDIEFCNNEIDDDATKPLVIAILHWKMLKTLRLENNCFTENSKRLFEILKEFSNSASLSINYNGKVDKIISFITLLGYMMEIDINNSMIMTNVSKVEKLLLDCSEQNNTIFIANASKIFTRFVNLTDLNISGLMICQEVADNLAKAFDNNLCSLEYLVMNNCQLTSEIALKIIIKIRNCLKMRELQLCNNFIDDDVTVMQAIVITIFQLNCFKEFKFEGNQFSCESESIFQFLLSHLSFSASSLDLSNNLYDLTSFITLLGYMKEVPTNTSRYVDNISKVHHLDLNCLEQQTSLELTNISSEGFQIFNHLISLNISGLMIKANVASCLVKAFSNNLQLEQLFINNCHITSPTINVFCQQLKLNSLKTFEVRKNFIDDEATEELAIAILHWNLLESIKFEENQFSTQGMLLLEMLTRDLESDVTIDFINNHDVVKSFIEVLDYASNNGSKGVQQFLSSLIKVTKLSLRVEEPIEITLNESNTLRKLQNITLFDINGIHNGERVTQFLSNLMRVTEICLQVETPLEMTLNASNTLQRFLRNITSFSISGIIITEQVANNLGHIFDNNKTSLKRLIINACELTSNTISKFVHQLKFTNKITEAEFCTNEIGDDATKDLVIAILHWNALHTLKLENNCFTENSKELFEIIKEFSKSPSTCIKYNGKIDKIFPFISLLGYMTEVDVKNSVLVANFTKIEKLLLDCSRLNISEQFEINASRFFTRFNNLTDLNISGIIISEKVADNLVKGFGSNFECLIMNNCHLTSMITSILITKLRNCLRMRKLSLCNNLIDDNTTQALIVSIVHWNYFEDFKFEGNRFNKKSKLLLQFLLSHLKFSGLSLNLSSNYDDLTSFVTLLGYMKDIPTDKSCFVNNISKVHHVDLNCSRQQTSLELPVSLSEGFQIFNHLISLNLSGLIIKENAADCLDKVFCNNLQLERLFMNKCKIYSSTINVLCRQLKYNPLKTCELNKNFMDDKAIEELAIAVLNWDLLESIKLEENQFSTQGMFLLNMLTKDLESEVIIKFLKNDCVLKSFIKVLDYASNNNGERVTRFLNNFRKVTEVSLRAESPFSPKELALSCVDINKLTKNVCLLCKKLRKLELNGIYFTSNYNITVFIECMSTCPILQVLILTNCNLDSTSAVRLFSHRQQFPTAFQKLTNLDLSHNLIGKDAVNSLANSIIHMPKLTAFCVIGNQVGNYLDTIFRIFLDWKSIKSSVRYYKTSNVDETDHISAFFAILSSAKDISKKDSCQINNIIKINKLVLKNTHHEIPVLNKDASYFIKRFTTLQELNLTGVYIEQSAMSVINNALNNNLASLQTLVMCKCTLNSDSAKALLLSSKNAIPVAFNTLKEVDLSHNHITDEVIELLISSFIQMPNLIKLNLDNNKFDTKAMSDMIFEFKTVSSTVFKNDNTSVKYFIAMLSSMKKFSTEHICQVRNITEVENLTLQSIERVKLHENASLFFQRFTKLSILRLFGFYIEPQSIANLSRALVYNLSSLEELMLSNCKLDSKSAVKLLSTDQETIPVCFGKLRIIDFSCNLIDDDALKPLLNSFLQIPDLQKPHLYGNNFTNIMAILIILYDWRNYKTSEINYSNRHDARAYTSAFFTLVSCIEDAIFEESLNKNITAVNSLSLANHDHDNPIILTEIVATFFLRFTNLTELNLSGIHIHKETMKNLGYTLQNNPGLLNLKLNYCQLDSDLVKKVLYPGGRRIVLMNLKTFDLSFNNIDNKANSVLIQSLIEMPKLESLKVTGNKFSRSDERAFNSVLSEFCTYKSSINYNKADNSTECIEAFLILLSALNDTTERKSNQIQNITRVEILHLHCKEYLKLSKEASLFFVNFFRLTTLNLSGICITAIVSKNLAKALQNNHHFLQILVLSQCKLDYESVLNLFGINTENTATQLSKTLITFYSLSTLDISNNDIMNDAARPLITLFLQMPKLVELNIDGNYFSVETFIALEFMFAFNKGISIIDSTYPTICRYRPQNISNSFSQKPRGRTYYGSLLHYDYSFVNLYCMYNRTIISYKPSVYALAFIDLLECAKNVNSIQVRNILKIEKLILDCVEQKDTTLSKDGFIFLNSLANLKELKLNGVSVNTEAVTVEKFNHLQKLTLAKCHLSSEATITILSLLNKCTIIDLCLSHNHITCKAGEAIKEFVDKNNTLINIDLSSNEFKDEGATIIIQSLCTCFCLKTFNLSHNRITDEFTYQLVTSLLKMPNCVEVDIKGNNFKKHIDIKSITKIITNCKNMQPVVTYKSLDYVNSFITLIGCLQSNHHEIFSQSKNISTAYKLCLQSVIFCKLTKEASLFFKNFGNLIEMKLNGIFINTAARRILAETIAINLPSLKFLELSHCGLDSSSAIAIVSSLKRKQIKELCLSQNKIDYNATSALKRFLENNIILNKFDISYNHIGTEGIKIISPTFVGCKGLESLNLSYNDITDEATVPLVSSLVQMPNLTEVQYHGNDDCDIPQVLNTIAELKTTQHFHQTFHSDEEVSAFLKLLACVKDVPTENSQQVRNLRKIEKLCLKLSSHNQPINETAALVIKQFTRLTTLNFQGITIANLGVAEIMADALSSNLNSLQYLRLSNCKLDSNLIIALLPSNKPSVPTAYKVLQEIDLTNNNICDKAIVSLTASLLQMCQLKKLHFDRNQLKNYNIKTIFQIIVELKVTKSTVEYFNNGKDSADYVSSFLSLLSSAKDISLEASQQVKNITNVSKLTLCCTDKLKCVLIEESSIFFERFTSLQTLDFYGIKFQLQAVTVFAKALALNLHSLEKLNLSACELTPDTTIEIISSLRKEKLKVLCLSHNELDFNSMKVISNFVVNNTILTEINISHNEVNTEGILTLTEGLSYCRNLEKLDLSHNKITDDATESLHKLMKQFYQYGNFKSLQIDNNYLSQQSIKTIQSAVS